MKWNVVKFDMIVKFDYDLVKLYFTWGLVSR